jgi:hypothetical protein
MLTKQHLLEALERYGYGCVTRQDIDNFFDQKLKASSLEIAKKFLIIGGSYCFADYIQFPKQIKKIVVIESKPIIDIFNEGNLSITI